MPPGDIERNPRRRSGMGPIIGLIVILALAGVAYYAWTALSPAPAPVETPTLQPETPVVQEQQYASSTMKFSLRYPQGFMLQEQYAYTRVSPTKPIAGVKFAVPTVFTEGTNLAADSGVSMEILPRANKCTGDIYIKANVKAQAVTAGAMTFSVATSSETTGKETFEEMVFAIPESSPCIAMRYFIHSTAIGGATSTATTSAALRPFDRAAVIAEFEKIRASLSVQ